MRNLLLQILFSEIQVGDGSWPAFPLAMCMAGILLGLILWGWVIWGDLRIQVPASSSEAYRRQIAAEIWVKNIRQFIVIVAGVLSIGGGYLLIAFSS